MELSILTSKLPTQRLNVSGITVSKKKKLNQILEILKQRPSQPKDLAQLVGIKANTLSKRYLPELIKSGKITRISGTGIYQLADSNKTKSQIFQEIHQNSEILNTNLVKQWIQLQSKTNKNYMGEIKRFANICLGVVNPKFKIHPDSINQDNYKDIIRNMVQTILEAQGKPPTTKLNWGNKQVLRHIIIFGLDKNLTESEARQLGIDGEKDKPHSATLHITHEQLELAKKLVKKDGSEAFSMFGIQMWTGVRPSIIFTLKTEDLEFYDREIKYVELDGKRFYRKETIESLQLLSNLLSNAKNVIKFDSYTHRACRIPKVHEFKQDEDYQKFIWDEEFVIELEKYVHQRKSFYKKKYLFWNDNNTEFTFENYTDIVKNAVNKQNKFLKEIMLQIGFKKEDFGKNFRANYGMRHFSIQSWLELTNNKYDFVAKMFHKTADTTKTWYGEMIAESFEKELMEIAH